jgi:hypothetical protein
MLIFANGPHESIEFGPLTCVSGLCVRELRAQDHEYLLFVQDCLDPRSSVNHGTIDGALGVPDDWTCASDRWHVEVWTGS